MERRGSEAGMFAKDTTSINTRESNASPSFVSPSCRNMFSLCISSLSMDEEARYAAATPSLQRLAFVREEVECSKSNHHASSSAVVVIQECPELVSAFDRSNGGGLPATTRSLRASLATNGGATPSPPKSMRHSQSNLNASGTFSLPQIVRNLHPTPLPQSPSAAELYLKHMKIRWISEDILVCFCRHESRRWSGLTVVAVDRTGGGGEDASAPLWASPPTAVALADGCGWSTHITPAMLQRFVMCGTKQGLITATQEELRDVLSFNELSDEDAKRIAASVLPVENETTAEEEDIILSNIFNIEEDVVRGGIWAQMDSVLASIRFTHVGRGLFRYDVCQRVPLNNNFLNAEKGYLCPRWATAQRLVFVLDDEFQEIKAWNIHSVPAICLMNIPLGGLSSVASTNNNAAASKGAAAAAPASTSNTESGSPSNRVDSICCSEDGGMLFLVNALGIRIVSTHQLRDILSPSHTSSSRKLHSGVGDCARVFCGDELQDEQSSCVAWDKIGRATSTKKQRLFRNDRPHALHGISPADVRRIAVVEDNISVVCHSGDTLLLTSHGAVADRQNIFVEPITQKKSGLALHVGRPPLPSHVVELVVYRNDSTTVSSAPSRDHVSSSGCGGGGCRAWFATSSIDRDSLLRNEIRFDVSAIAIRLCELNGWDSTHVQDTTLRIALQESPEQVYASIEEVFLRETVVGGGVGNVERQAALVYSPGKARVAATSADIHIRPNSSMQLLCRLVRVVCSKFDHCPDDIQARSTLRILMSTTIRVATLLLHHRACAHQLYMDEEEEETKEAVDGSTQRGKRAPAAAKLYLDALQSTGVLLTDLSTITPPSSESYLAPSHDDGDNPCTRMDEDAMLAANDVYFLSSVIHGLRCGLEHVPEGAPICTASSALPWCSRLRDAGVLPSYTPSPTVSTPAPAAGSSLKQSPPKKKAQRASSVERSEVPAELPTTWASFQQYVCALLSDRTRGIASTCLLLREVTHCLSPSLLETVASVVITKRRGGSALSQPTPAAPAAASELDIASVLVSGHKVWQLVHLQRIVGYLVMDRVARATALPSEQGVPELLEECNVLLTKVYGRTRMVLWWKMLYRTTTKDSIRALATRAAAHGGGECGGGGGDNSRGHRFTCAMERLFSVIPDGIRPIASEGTLSRVVHSRLLFSHGSFVPDGGMTTVSMTHNSSFLLLHEAEDEDFPLDDEGQQQRINRALMARTVATTNQQHNIDQVVSGPRDVKDVTQPSAGAGGVHAAGALYDPTSSDPIVLGSLAMLKPTQPLPYTDIALSWVDWAPNMISLPQESHSSFPSLFDPACEPWDGVFLEQLLFLRRDSQVENEALQHEFLRQLAADAGDKNGRAHRLFAFIEYTFRHYDLEALSWICHGLFSGSPNGSSLADFQFARGVLLSTLNIIAFECRAAPENTILLHVQSAWCKDALKIMALSATSLLGSVLQTTSILEPDTLLSETKDALFRDVFQPWGALLPVMLHWGSQNAVDNAALQTVVGRALRTLSPSLPTATLHLCSRLLRSSPNAWNGVCLSDAVPGDSNAKMKATQLVSLLQFHAFQSAFALASTTNQSSNEGGRRKLEAFEHWLAASSAALLPLTNHQLDACDNAVVDVTSMFGSESHALERLLKLVQHSLACTDDKIPIHPLVLWVLYVAHPTNTEHAAQVKQLLESQCNRFDGAEELLLNLKCINRDERSGEAAVSVRHPAEDGTPAPATLRELLVGSACSLGSYQNNEFWTFRLRTNRDDSSEVIFRRGTLLGEESLAGSSAASSTSTALPADVIRDFVLSTPQSNKDVTRVVEQLPRWNAVPPLVRISERAEDVQVDMWALLLDGRPLSAFQRWMSQKPTNTEQRLMISAARAIAFQQHSRLELHASIAAFMHLVDPQEFDRFLMDCSVLSRVSGGLQDADESGNHVGRVKTSSIAMPALTAARHLTLLTPASSLAGTHRSTEEHGAIRALLDALENTTAAAASSSGASQDVRGKLLAVHFVSAYQGQAAALAYFFERIASDHMRAGDWASTFAAAWACGVTTQQWVTLPEPLASKATTATLMYVAQAHVVAETPPGQDTGRNLVCDVSDWNRRPSTARDSSSRTASVELLETVVSGSSRERSGVEEEGGDSGDSPLSVATRCAAVLVAQSPLHPASVTVVRYIGAMSHDLGVVSSAESAALSMSARLATSSACPWTSGDDENIMQVLLAVMASRDIAISTATRMSLKALHTDQQHQQELTATPPEAALTVLDVAESMLLLHEALLSHTYGAALRVLTLLTSRLSTSALDCDIVSLFLRQVAQLHLLPDRHVGGPPDCSDDDVGGDEDDEGDEDDCLHPNLFSVVGVILKALEQWKHPAAASPIVVWMRVALMISDGDVPTASARCRETAAAFLCCRPVLRLLMEVLRDSTRQVTAPQVMMASLNRHPKLTAECIQELSSTVDGMPSITAGGSDASTAGGARARAGPFVVAVRQVEDIVFHSGLFSCESEHPQLMQVGLDAAAKVICKRETGGDMQAPQPMNLSLAVNALVHCLLSHTTTEETTAKLCSHVVSAVLVHGGELSSVAAENISNCDAFLRAVMEHMPCEGSSIPKVIFRILLGTMAETDEAKIAASAFANAPLTRSSLLNADTVSAVQPTLRHRPSLRAWLRRHFATEVAATAPSNEGGRMATAASDATEDSIGFIEDYVSGELIDEAKSLMERAEALHAAATTPSASHKKQAASSAALQQDQSALLWKCTNSVLSRCMQDNGILQLIPFLATFPTNPLSAHQALWSLQQLLNQCIFCVLRSHYVPLMHDISQRLFARDKRHPTALADFEQSLTEFFFVSGLDQQQGHTTTSVTSTNFFGLGEASGWLCKERILAICSMLQQLQPLLDAARSLRQHSDNSGEPWSQQSGTDGDILGDWASRSSSSASSQPLAGASCLVSAFAEGIVSQCNRFQSFVRLPSRSYYPRLFLEPLVMMLVHGYWILQRQFDEGLAAKLTKELSCVMNVCAHDGDFEQMRRIVFAVGDTSVLEYIVNCIPVSQLVTLANSSPDFQLQPLHRSTMRIAIMSFFDRLSLQETFLHASRVEMTTLYANFRHFTALGDRLEHEAHHMLQGFIAQHSTQKKGLLDSQKDALRRQNRMLDEIDTRFLSAANFFIQDGQFERCLVCIRDLYLIQVQKKTSSVKVLGLEQDQAVQVMANQLDAAQDVVALGYGYQITDHADWAAVLYRQVVHRGKRDVFSAYRAQAVSLSPLVRKGLADMWRADTSAHKDSAKKQAWQWLEDEMQRSGSGGQ